MTKTFKETLPIDLITHITAICGTRGEQWFEQLPSVVAELEAEWDLQVDEPFPGIEFNFVAAAVKNNTEEPVVVKIAPPFEKTEIFAEAKYLRTRNGSTTVRLLGEDRARHAILIERALPGFALFQQFNDDPIESVQPAITVLKAILRPPPSNRSDVDTLDNWFANFKRYRETDFPKERADKAFEIYERLSIQPGRTFYLHGDFHPGNIVTATRESFLAIDPKGIVGHLGYDIAVFLNNLHWWRRDCNSVGGLLDDAVRQFAGAFDLAEKEVREWAFACMVIGAWWNFEDMPEQFDGGLAMSDIWGV